MTTYQAASEVDFFNETLNSLAVYLYHSDNGLDYDPDLEENQLKKSAWVASILAASEKEEHQRLALAFGTMAYEYVEEESPLYEQYLYIILSRIGNLPGTSQLETEEESQDIVEGQIAGYDPILSLELENEAAAHRIGQDEYLTAFQQKAWMALNEGKNLAISGPTSSGKSFILQKYIEEEIEQNEVFQGLYVVPTRALISEVSGDLSRNIDGISVRNGAYFSDVEEDENIFLVVTPERCLKLVEEDVRGQIDPDLIFFDEFQSLEKDGRGVLFETIIQEVEEYWGESQIVAAGPYLENPKEKLVELTKREVEEITTVLSPVLQLGVTLRFISQRKQNNRKMGVIVHSPTGDSQNFEVDEPEDITYTDVKRNRVPKIINEYGGRGKEIIYSHTRNKAEDWALSIAENRGVPDDLSAETEDLLQYLRENVHEEYSLVKCLESGVAFHHGRVPDIVRNEIESIYGDLGSNVDTLICTPTLLQGVNLPSRRMFITTPRRGNDDLTKFEFANLIGRVGRLQKRLYGTVYFVETNKDKWSSEKYDTEKEKEITSATEKALSDEKSELVEHVDNPDLYEVEDGSVRYTSVLLRNKHLKESKNIAEYLEEKGLEKPQIATIQSKLNRFLSDINVPESILERNPMVDPFRVDLLYKQVRTEPDAWIIKRRHGLYEQFEDITRNLNEIFKFANSKDIDVYLTHEQSEVGDYPLSHVITTGNYWLQGRSFKYMIEKRHNHPNIGSDDINGTIQEVMELVNTGVRHVLVKYYKLLLDILDEIQESPDEWMQTFDQMLELGSLKFNDLHLIGQGVDRSVANDLNIPEEVDDPDEYLQTKHLKLSSFNERHLQNQNLL